jgi:Cu/Ag efflux protein CusF
MQRRRIMSEVLVIVSVLLGVTVASLIHAGTGLRPYETEGIVVAVMPDQGFLLVDHDPIQAPGFLMNKMEMPFSVDDPALIKGLTPGDHVRFRVSEEKKSRILEIHKLAK